MSPDFHALYLAFVASRCITDIEKSCNVLPAQYHNNVLCLQNSILAVSAVASLTHFEDTVCKSLETLLPDVVSTLEGHPRLIPLYRNQKQPIGMTENIFYLHFRNCHVFEQLSAVIMFMLNGVYYLNARENVIM